MNGPVEYRAALVRFPSWEEKSAYCCVLLGDNLCTYRWMGMEMYVWIYTHTYCICIRIRTCVLYSHMQTKSMYHVMDLLDMKYSFIYQVHT